MEMTVIQNANLILVIIRVESFNFTFSKKLGFLKKLDCANIFDSFFFYFTLLKTENTWPTIRAFGEITNVHKELT